MEISNWLLYSVPALVGFVVVSIVIGTLLIARRRSPSRRQQRDTTSSLASLTNVSSKTRYPIDNVPWRIGRSRTTALSIDDHSVSRVHAEIIQDGDGHFYLVDLESLNGSYVNEQRVTKQKLVSGDIVDVGDIRFQFIIEA